MNEQQTSKIAIVGGGPAGLILAIALARRDIQTTVFEQLPHPAVAPRFNADRSYSIDITGHGLKALEYIDAVDHFDANMIAFKGIKLPKGNEEARYHHKGWTGSRGDILRTLMSLIDKHYSQWIDFEFETCVDSIDVHSGDVITTTNGVSQRRSFDFIVGADGGGSMVRHAMEEQITDFTTEYDEIPNYSTMVELDQNMDGFDKHYLHILNLSPFCIAGAIDGGTDDGSVRWFCVYGTDYESSFDSVDQARDKLLADAPRMLQHMSDASLAAFATRHCYHIGRMLSCSHLYGGKAVLLGDAGAPFSPIGQGINAAMESAMILAMCITGDQPEQLYDAAQRYHDQWKPEADAITWISTRMVFDNKPHILRMVLTNKLGLNVMDNAKDPDRSYSEIMRQAEKLKLVWAW